MNKILFTIISLAIAILVFGMAMTFVTNALG